VKILVSQGLVGENNPTPADAASKLPSGAR